MKLFVSHKKHPALLYRRYYRLVAGPPHPGPKPVVLALLVSGDVVVRVSAIPPELVLLVCRHVDVLEVPVRLLPVAALPGLHAVLRVRVRARKGRRQRRQQEERDLC